MEQITHIIASKGVHARNAARALDDPAAVVMLIAVEKRQLVLDAAKARLRALIGKETADEALSTLERVQLVTKRIEFAEQFAASRRESLTVHTPAPAPPTAPPPVPDDLLEGWRVCTRPGCGHRGPIDTDFGWRVVNTRARGSKVTIEHRYSQPQCKPCRRSAAAASNRKKAEQRAAQATAQQVDP